MAADPKSISIPNFRDVGGHATSDGGRIRTGRLFRSVALDSASDDDLATLAALGVTMVIDMRRPHEQSLRPDRLPVGAELLSLDVFADGEDAATADIDAVLTHLREPERVDARLDVDDMARFQLASYHDLVMLGSARSAYARFFRTLTTTKGAALVHCTGGKDRTGWAVAALLSLLGVPEDDIFADYLISDLAVRTLFAEAIDDFEARGGQREVMERMFGARREYLAASFRTVSDEYGSVEAYFIGALGLEESEVEALREAFLE